MDQRMIVEALASLSEVAGALESLKPIISTEGEQVVNFNPVQLCAVGETIRASVNVLIGELFGNEATPDAP